jgi:hypothetical protein
MKTSVILFVTLFMITSCTDVGDENVNDSLDKGGYLFTITGSEGGPRVLEGTDVDTNWDKDLGFIYLNADAKNEPLGTVYITIGPVMNGEADILSGTVSKTDVQSGTAEVLNARTFTLITDTNNKVKEVKIGSNYISAKFEMKMERVLNWPEDQPESVTVEGNFVAVKK